MTVLKYRDPSTGQWVALGMRGPAGDAGPLGPQGPSGSVPADEVFIGASQPAAEELLWVSDTRTLRYDSGGSAYRVPAKMRGARMVNVATPTAATDAANRQYLDQRRATPDPTWTYPVFQNGWTNYDGHHAGAAYRKLGNGMVAMQGLIRSGPLGTTAFQLKPGYRPTTLHHITAIGGTNAVVLVEVQSGGDVVPHWWGSSGTNAWVSITTMFYAG